MSRVKPLALVMSWESIREKEEAVVEEGETPLEELTDEDVEKLIKQPVAIRSNICCALYGHDGTGKSGCAIDCRTPEEVKEGKKVIVIDLDGSAGPIKMQYFDNDPNIVILDPMTVKSTGEIDYVATYNKTLAFVRYIVKNEEKLNLAAVVLDGLDTLLKTAEQVMRIEDLKVNPDARIKDIWSWGIRNRKYLTPIILLKRLNCHRFFTTHLKELRTLARGPEESGLVTVGWQPDWQRQTPGLVFQKVALRREEEDNVVRFIGKVEKCKTNVNLEGKEYIIAEVANGEAKWYGLKKFYEEASKR